jgi:hypothetical protein
MKQGVLSNTRVRLLLKEGASCYRARRVGERKRKSVRGCIVASDIAVLNLVIIKKGETEIEGKFGIIIFLLYLHRFIHRISHATSQQIVLYQIALYCTVQCSIV